MGEQIRTKIVLAMSCLAVLPLIGCASLTNRDLAHDPFPEAQEGIREVIQSMDDASTSGDVDTLAAHHLNTDKFSRFGGDKFERVGYEECIAVETWFFSAVKNLAWDMQGLKIDVFGDVAVVTVTPEFSFTSNGQTAEGATRLTLVFLKTLEGWKIVHEHGTLKSCFDQSLKSRQASDEPNSGGRSIVAADHSLDTDGVTQKPVVETVSGRVRGAVDGGVASYEGIPFAAPPVGDLRWRAPQPPQPWEGVRDAIKPGPICLQGGDSQIEGSEDCLCLNVWAPHEPDGELGPVLFWIHGGGFRGGGTIDPREEGSILAREGIVVVTANYRLGRLGFFAHPALTAENADGGRLANYGIMDQIAALEWVRDNIASFGGDPDNVTIAGESAGGISVNHLMTSPLTRGLFARAIVQSGSARDNELLPFRLLADERPGRRSAEWVGVRFAEGQGIKGSNGNVLAALRALPTSVVADGLNMMTREEYSFGGPIGDGVVVPDHYEAIYRAGDEHPVPLIVGATDADGFHFFLREPLKQIFERFGAFQAEAEALYDAAGNGDPFRVGTYASSDPTFIEPARHIARLHAANGHPTWQYRFSYVPEHLRDERVGAIHASDIQFVFGTIASFFKPTPNDKRVTDTMRAYWRSFIRDGNPDPDGLPAWPRFAAEDDVILDFRNEGPTVGPDPARKRLDFVERVAESKRQGLRDESPISLPGAQSRVYKKVGDTQLRLHVFSPPGASDQARPAIVYFFGGGWIGGSVTQLAPRCEYFCARGVVAVAADYRVKSRHQVGAFECVADAKSAIRWLRAHAAELGIDENRIVAAGGSSGGHLAASTALIDGLDEPNEDLAVSSVPNALVLHSPALDLPSIFGAMDRENAVVQFGEWVTRCEPVSPLTHVRPDAPPTIIFHGTADAPVPFEHSQRFAKAMRAQGNRCELVAYDGRSHGFSLLEAGDGSDFSDTLRRTDEFLISLDYLTGKPTADVFTYAKQVDRFFDSDGVRIRYVDVGPRGGEPIVLVAGFSQSIEQAWGTTGVIDALDEDHRVIALDLRGHGKSDKPHETGAYGNEMVADLVRLLDHLKIDKAHIVGYSMGGRVVAKLVADHPERVKTAMPSATSIEPPDEEGTSFVERMAKSLETSGSIRPALEHFNADGSMTEEQVEQIVAMVRDTNDTKALAAVIRSVDDFLPERAKLAANRVPCLSIIGEHDPNLTTTKKTAEYMANLEIHVIEGANHMTAFRNPAFVAAIRSFIAKHASVSMDATPSVRRAIDETLAEARRAVDEHGLTEPAMRRMEAALARLGKTEDLMDHADMGVLHGSSAMGAQLLMSKGDHGLSLFLVRFAGGTVTPVHDHLTWGVIHVLQGQDRYTAWERFDDGAGPHKAQLRISKELMLGPGDSTHWYGPPKDIHAQEAYGGPVWELVMTGENVLHEHVTQHRHYFDPESGRVTTGTAP